MRPSLVRHFLEQACDRADARIALVCGEDRSTYGELEASANRLAHGLRAAGVVPGEPLVLVVDNSRDAVVALFAAAKVGAVFTLVDATCREARLERVVRDSGARMVLHVDGRTRAVALRARERIPFAAVALRGEALEGGATARQLLEGRSSERPLENRSPRDAAYLVYTSGTRGEPKGVQAGSDSACFVIESIVEYLENTADDVVVSALPLSHGYGLYQLFACFRVGATLVLERNLAFPAALLQRLAAVRATGLPLVPSAIVRLLPALQAAGPGGALRSLRYATSAAAPLPRQHVQALRRHLGDARLFLMYGQSECARGLYLPPEELDARVGSTGIAIPGTEAWLETDGRRSEPGELGELVLRGRHVMSGYWRRPELTASVFSAPDAQGERTLRTGDLFRRDEDGFFTFVCRGDELINRGGVQVSPAHVEEALLACEGIRDVAVTGAPDDVLGERVCAFVVAEEPRPDRSRILRHCRQHLEDEELPSDIVFVESLPHSNAGKVDKQQLLRECAG